jgi:LysR family glycine cleavage system transcriptional activator
MRRPALNSLRSFDAAARHLNFRLAAEEMHLTQGAVAQQVRKLESDLGLPLFRRLARGLALTKEGAGYHAEVRRALQIIDQATEALIPERRVTLSVPPSLASKWLLPRLPSLNQRHPGLELQLTASEAVSQIPGGEADLAIRQGPEPGGQNVSVACLAPIDLVAVASPSGAHRAEALGDLAPLPLIEDGHRHWHRLFRAAGLPPPGRTLDFNQTALAMDAAANGQGIALAPRLLAQDDLASGRLMELWSPDPDPGQGFYLICPLPPLLKPEAQAVADWLLSLSGQ